MKIFKRRQKIWNTIVGPETKIQVRQARNKVRIPTQSTLENFWNSGGRRRRFRAYLIGWPGRPGQSIDSLKCLSDEPSRNWKHPVVLKPHRSTVLYSKPIGSNRDGLPYKQSVRHLSYYLNNSIIIFINLNLF